MGIRGQLALVVSGPVALLLALASVAVTNQERASELEAFRIRNERVLRTVAVAVGLELAQGNVGALDTLVGRLATELAGNDLVELVVCDLGGQVVAHSDPDQSGSKLTDEFSMAASQSRQTTWQRKGNTLRLAVAANSGDRWGTVQATFSLEHLESRVGTLRQRWYWGTLALFVLLSGAMYLGLDRFVVRPVRLLQHTLRRMHEGQLRVRAPPLKARELKELADNVNQLAQALQSERDSLQGLVEERTKELTEANAQLARLAVTDGLTGLNNHRRFQEALHAELLRCSRHQRPLSVLMVDVDFFKRVNDAMGHPAGDELLRQLAAVLSVGLRETDLIARYGGEEFAVILPETTKTEAAQVAERMRAAVELGINQGAPWVQKITVSIGVATYPEDGASAERVLEATDQALYVAKRQGRNRVACARAA